jgi:hypothetical protein
VLTSWCAYQSARWSGVQATSYNRASSVRTESLRFSTLANRQLLIDINLFTAYAAATSNNNRQLADFLTQRFPDRLKVAMRAWLATRPMTNKAAPSSPFAMPQYHLTAQDEAAALEQQAGQLFNQGLTANETSDRYVLLTVLFAAVSFLAGVGSKFLIPSVKIAALVLAGLVWIVTLIVLIKYPILP